MNDKKFHRMIQLLVTIVLMFALIIIFFNGQHQKEMKRLILRFLERPAGVMILQGDTLRFGDAALFGARALSVLSSQQAKRGRNGSGFANKDVQRVALQLYYNSLQQKDFDRLAQIVLQPELVVEKSAGKDTTKAALADSSR